MSLTKYINVSLAQEVNNAHLDIATCCGRGRAFEMKSEHSSLDVDCKVLELGLSSTRSM